MSTSHHKGAGLPCLCTGGTDIPIWGTDLCPDWLVLSYVMPSTAGLVNPWLLSLGGDSFLSSVMYHLPRHSGLSTMSICTFPSTELLRTALCF